MPLPQLVILESGEVNEDSIGSIIVAKHIRYNIKADIHVIYWIFHSSILIFVVFC